MTLTGPVTDTVFAFEVVIRHHSPVHDCGPFSLLTHPGFLVTNLVCHRTSSDIAVQGPWIWQQESSTELGGRMVGVAAACVQ